MNSKNPISHQNNIIIIGAGLSGVLMACQLQRQLGFTNFEIYEKSDEFGGTWYQNTYPGCACDVPSYFYSYSFAKKSDWTKIFPPQPEIQEYILGVCKDYGLAKHTHFNTECLGAEWNKEVEQWNVQIKDLKTQNTYTKTCQFLVMAAGVLSVPNPCPVPGIEKFKGGVWHSAQWNHQVSIENKDVVVIGNGCSAVQFVPVILPKVKTLTHIIRSPHWILYRPNGDYSERFKWVMKNIPGANTLYRSYWAAFLDSRWIMFRTKTGRWIRNAYARAAEKYMKKQAPEKYHNILIPKFEMGAKRRVFDTTYLASLHDPKIFLINDPIIQAKEKSVVTKSGKEYPADVIVYATGFRVREILFPMTIKGKSGEDLRSRWDRQGGVRGYMGVMVADFPNMFMIVGPNTVSGHFSVLFMAECNVNFIIKLMKPLLRNVTKGSIEVTEKAEKKDVDWVQSRLKNCIWGPEVESGWYVDKKTGHNPVIYPNFQSNYWLRTLRPDWSDFNFHGIKSPRKFRLDFTFIIIASIIIVISWLLLTKVL